MFVVFPPIFVADTKLIYDYNFLVSFNDTHTKKSPSNKIPALTKSMNMEIWVVVL